LTRKVAATIASVAFAALIVALASPSLAESNQRGEDLFGLCQQCHGPEGAGMQLSLAPAIAGLDQWYVQVQLEKFKSGARGLHAQDLGGLRMYPMSQWLENTEDIAAVSEYVAALPVAELESTLEGGDAHKGETAYALCAACHGKVGEGNKTMNSPPLRGMSDWYLLTTIQKFKDGVRGTNSKNPTEMMMRGMALSLADDQAMKDVVAYIMTLNNIPAPSAPSNTPSENATQNQ
jgi:cytochrome c oxidase subunit 2